MAERRGFEPPRGVNPWLISNQLPSTTRPPLRNDGYYSTEFSSWLAPNLKNFFVRAGMPETLCLSDTASYSHQLALRSSLNWSRRVPLIVRFSGNPSVRLSKALRAIWAFSPKPVEIR